MICSVQYTKPWHLPGLFLCHPVLVDGPVAISFRSFTSKMLPTGKIVDSLFFIRMTVENGLIITCRLQEDSYAVSVAMTP